MSSWRLTSLRTLIIFATIASFILLHRSLAEGARIKIHITPEVRDDSLLHVFPRQTPESACNDKEVTNNLRLPQNIRSRLNSRVQFYSSESAKTYIDTHVFTRKVSGLSEQTVGNVFETLREEQCYPFFYGGLVRDMFLARMPGDVDVEADCDVNEVYRICTETWGERNCLINTETMRAHIGQIITNFDDLLDFASTESTFFANLSFLEYTVNSMAYDLNVGNNTIIDLTGNGVADVCNRTIQIPSDSGSEESWDSWRLVPGGTDKLYRFWKLRTKGLSPLDDATLQYIVRYTMMDIEKNPNSFKKFYCKTIYGDNNYNSMSNTCRLSKQMCLMYEGKAESYKQRFREDFGNYYDATLEATIPKCGKLNDKATMFPVLFCCCGITIIY